MSGGVVHCEGGKRVTRVHKTLDEDMQLRATSYDLTSGETVERPVSG